MRFTLLIVVLLAVALPAAAGTLTEDFNAPFPAWESGWLGVNSNLVNYYFADGYPNTFRGNNPDGLWVADSTTVHNSGDVTISFVPSFAATLTSLSIDLALYQPVRFEIFDATGQTLLSDALTAGGNATTDPGVYSHYSATSTTGIGGFRFLGSQIEGWTSIDNVVVNQGESSVPEPAALGLIGLGLLALAGIGRRRAR